MNLSPANLQSLANLASDETARYSLTGVYVQFDHDGGYTACATNGRYLGIATGPTPDADDYPAPPSVANAPNSAMSATIPQNEWVAAFKSLPKQRKRSPLPWCAEYVACVPSWDATTLATTDGRGSASSAVVENIEGRFPNYREVLPKGAPTATVQLNPKMLIELLKVATSYTDSENERITLELRSEKAPIVVRVDGREGQQFTGLLMPLTADR